MDDHVFSFNAPRTKSAEDTKEKKPFNFCIFLAIFATLRENSFFMLKHYEMEFSG